MFFKYPCVRYLTLTIRCLDKFWKPLKTFIRTISSKIFFENLCTTHDFCSEGKFQNLKLRPYEIKIEGTTYDMETARKYIMLARAQRCKT